jgi:large subunit ribosomal protein L21
MYAIVKAGGKQYRVEEGDSLLVDRMREEEGATVNLDALMLADGDKAVIDPADAEKIKVEAVVVGHERGQKVHVLKFKPKRGYRRRSGHRSDLTRLEIREIKLLSRRPAKKKGDEESAGSAAKKKGDEESTGSAAKKKGDDEPTGSAAKKKGDDEDGS